MSERLKFDAPLRSLSYATSLKNEGRRGGREGEGWGAELSEAVAVGAGERARTDVLSAHSRARGGGCARGFLNGSHI